MRPRVIKVPKERPVNYELITADSPVGHPVHFMMHQLIAEYHQPIAEARIVLMWCTSWKPDQHGHLKLGMCKKASDVEKEILGSEACDFVIMLNRIWWRHPQVTQLQRRAVLDHELCHAGPVLDEQGHQKVDERKRLLWQIVPHDIEEFSDIVGRHGAYTSQLEVFAAQLLSDGYPGWQACSPECAETKGYIATLDAENRPVLTRCRCWLDYQEERKAAVG